MYNSDSMQGRFWSLYEAVRVTVSRQVGGDVWLQVTWWASDEVYTSGFSGAVNVRVFTKIYE